MRTNEITRAVVPWRPGQGGAGLCGVSTSIDTASGPVVPPEPTASRPGRTFRLLLRDFGRVHRHAGDLVRVGIGAAVLWLGFLAAQQGELTALERNVFRLVNELPALFLPLVWAVMQLGNVVAVPVLAGLAAARRRWALARDLLVAGGAAYYAAIAIKEIVGRERPAGFPVGAVLHEGATSGAGFVSGHAAVAAALAAAASPYLTRTQRRVVWGLALATGLSRVYVGAHLPLDIVGGAALGWALAAGVHWLLGVPRWNPSPEVVSDLLAQLGLPMHRLRPATVPARSSHPFVGVDDRGRELFVKLLDPQPPDRDRLYRWARLVAVRDVKDSDSLAPLARQAEHEAVVTMAARQRGVRVPEVVLARGIGGRAVLVQERIAAGSLDGQAPADIDQGLLTRVWRQVALLHEARIAHRDLVASNVVVDDDGEPWLVDFGNAESGADDELLAEDVAELAVSLALRNEPRTVVRTAADVLGEEAVERALPFLQPLALSAVTRAALRQDRGRLGAVRREVRDLLGLPSPERHVLPRARGAARGAVLLAAVAALVVVPLMAGAEDALPALTDQGWRWLGAAAALLLTGRLAEAAAQLATTDRRLAVSRAFTAQLAAAGSGLLYGSRAGAVAGARSLELAGLRPAAALASQKRLHAVGRGVAGAAAAVGWGLVALDDVALTWQRPFALLPLAAIAIGALLLVGGAQALSRRRAPASIPIAVGAAEDRGPAGGTTRAAPLVGWLSIALGCEALAFAALLHGVGADLEPLVAAAAYLTLRALWSLLPGAGGPAVAEASLVLLLTSLGGAPATAAGGVVLFRLLSYWLPSLVGSLLAARLERRLLL
jgi:glycosyltransferase 2 family protein